MAHITGDKFRSRSSLFDNHRGEVATFSRFLPEIGDHNQGGALLRQSKSDPSTDAAAGSRDDGHAAVQQTAHAGAVAGRSREDPTDPVLLSKSAGAKCRVIAQ